MLMLRIALIKQNRIMRLLNQNKSILRSLLSPSKSSKLSRNGNLSIKRVKRNLT